MTIFETEDFLKIHRLRRSDAAALLNSMLDA